MALMGQVVRTAPDLLCAESPGGRFVSGPEDQAVDVSAGSPGTLGGHAADDTSRADDQNALASGQLSGA
ncbi:hypothetical protein AB0C74_09500 [Spirillospora sp. NPDC048832]